MGHYHGIHWSYYISHDHSMLDRPLKGTNEVPDLRKHSQGMGCHFLGWGILIEWATSKQCLVFNRKNMLVQKLRSKSRCGPTYHHLRSSTGGFQPALQGWKFWFSKGMPSYKGANEGWLNYVHTLWLLPEKCGLPVPRDQQVRRGIDTRQVWSAEVGEAAVIQLGQEKYVWNPGDRIGCLLILSSTIIIINGCKQQPSLRRAWVPRAQAPQVGRFGSHPPVRPPSAPALWSPW